MRGIKYPSGSSGFWVAWPVILDEGVRELDELSHQRCERGFVGFSGLAHPVVLRARAGGFIHRDEGGHDAHVAQKREPVLSASNMRDFQVGGPPDEGQPRRRKPVHQGERHADKARAGDAQVPEGDLDFVGGPVRDQRVMQGVTPLRIRSGPMRRRRSISLDYGPRRPGAKRSGRRASSCQRHASGMTPPVAPEGCRSVSARLWRDGPPMRGSSTVRSTPKAHLGYPKIRETKLRDRVAQPARLRVRSRNTSCKSACSVRTSRIAIPAARTASSTASAGVSPA